MKLKTITAISLIGFFTLQSCEKKETVNSTTINKDSLREDSLAKLKTQPFSQVAVVEPGEMYSQLMKKKIILKKDAITLNSLKEGSTEQAYLLFNEDQSKAEVFMPNSQSAIFDRKETEGNYT